MKNWFRSVFAKTGKRKSKTGIILTIVALVEILAIVVVSTSAWIESISSIKVYTTAQTTAGGTKGVVASKLKQHLGLQVNNSTDIDLTQYFRPSGGYHLSGASSADGNVMYFPETKGNTTQKYRVGTINDKNVNYVSFTVKTTTGNVALAFDSTPTFKFDGTELPNDKLSLLRFSVGNGSTFKVFSLTSEFEDTVISGENATDTASSTVRAFSDYAVGNTNLVTTTTANGYLTFSMWIQDPTGANSDLYNNKALTVENLKLVAVKPFTLRSTYMNDNGSYVAGTTGGTVAINNGEFGETAVAYLKNGSVVTLKASPNTTNGYSFVQWSKTATGSAFAPNGNSSTGGTEMSAANCTNNNGIYSITYTFYTNHYSGDSGEYELYAQFNDRHILYLDPKYKHYSGNNGTTTSNKIKFFAYIWGSVNGQFKKEWYQGTEQTNGTYKFTYKGSANSVIFCYMSPSTPSAATVNSEDAGGTDVWEKYRWLQTYDLSFPLENGEYTYVVTARRDPYANTGQVLGYWKHSYALADVSKCTGTDSQNSSNTVSMYLDHAYVDPNADGNVNRYSNTYANRPFDGKFDGKQYTTDGDGATLLYAYNANVVLTATPGSAYNFAGWYTDAAGTTAVSASTGLVSGSYNSTSITVTRPNANAGSSGTTYYAKFTKKPANYILRTGTSGQSGWSETQMTQSGNTWTCTKTLSEGQSFNFQFKETTDGKYYGNGSSYQDKTSTSIVSNATLTQGGSDMYLKGHAGTYTFTFNSSNKQMTITASYIDITFTLTDVSGNQWLDDGDAIFWFDANGSGIKMTAQGTNSDNKHYWTVSFPSNTRTGNITIKRNNPENTATWNEWSWTRGYGTSYDKS